jgi:hypothetical protein
MVDRTKRVAPNGRESNMSNRPALGALLISLGVLGILVSFSITYTCGGPQGGICSPPLEWYALVYGILGAGIASMGLGSFALLKRGRKVVR